MSSLGGAYIKKYIFQFSENGIDKNVILLKLSDTELRKSRTVQKKSHEVCMVILYNDC